MEIDQNQHDEELSPKAARPRGIYLLPNLFTTAALFAAFYSIIAAVKGYFDTAAIAIFIAMAADTLDGRVARLTNTQSDFGAEYDSLSDMIAFGVAPALLAYTWALSQLGKLGWLAAFLYVAATALRLARFNTQTHDEDKRYFQGIPSPAAAAAVTTTVWLCAANHIMPSFLIAVMLAMLTVFVAALMVSTIRYHSFKQIDLKGRVPFFVVLIPVIILTAVAMDPPEVLFSMFIVYALSGPILTLWQIRKMRRDAKKVTKQN